MAFLRNAIFLSANYFLKVSNLFDSLPQNIADDPRISGISLYVRTNKKDDFEQKIVNALNVKANQQMQFKHAVIDNVFDRIEQQRHERFNRWGLAGFALAAGCFCAAGVVACWLIQTTGEPLPRDTPKGFFYRYL